jgi:hypothetical protein
MAVQVPLVEIMSKAKYLVRVFSKYAMKVSSLQAVPILQKAGSLLIGEEIDIANADSRRA